MITANTKEFEFIWWKSYLFCYIYSKWNNRLFWE